MESVTNLQAQKRDAIVSHGMTRGCSLTHFRTGCITDATTITTTWVVQVLADRHTFHAKLAVDMYRNRTRNGTSRYPM
jgi:hypothetical protein